MPSFSSSRGLSVTAECPEAVEAVDAFETNLLGLRAEVDAILRDAVSYPDTAMVQACAAVFHMYGQSAESLADSEVFLSRAEALAGEANDRERRFVRAIRSFRENAFHDALRLLEEQTRRYPGDLIAAKVAEFLYYCLGQHYSARRFSDHMKRLEDANAESAGYWSMRSFATELCGDYGAAKDEAERCLELDPIQPWAHHTLAHIVSREGIAGEGIAELEGYLPLWRRSNRGIHSHNAWHLGLLYLDRMDEGKLEDLLVNDLWGIAPAMVCEQVDTIALLWRLDLAGLPHETEWKEVAAKVSANAGQCLIPFLEGHFAYALARGGDEVGARNVVARAAERARLDDREALDVWAPVGARFVGACADFGAGRTREASRSLEPLLDAIPTVGGSDAQVDLFRQATIAGMVDEGRKADAEALFASLYPAKRRTLFDERVLVR